MFLTIYCNMIVLIFLAVASIIFIGRTVLNDRKDYIEWTNESTK